MVQWQPIMRFFGLGSDNIRLMGHTMSSDISFCDPSTLVVVYLTVV